MTRKKSKSTKRRSSLAVVGTLLILSAFLRLAAGASEVIASEAIQAGKVKTTDTSNNADLARPDQMGLVLEAIKKREARLTEREAEIDSREQTVAAAERAIEAELSKLEKAEHSLRQTISRASEAAETDVAQLTSVYADMKPKQAAALFEQMDAGFAAGFLARMPSDRAARIMAGLTPEKAYLISVELAGRNAEIPLD